MKDKRITIIDKNKNEGEDYARFSGIEIAKGDYITFLDADDKFIKDAIEKFVCIFKQTKADAMYGHSIRLFSEKFHIYRHINLEGKYLERIIKEQEKDRLLISFYGVNIVSVYLCGNILIVSCSIHCLINRVLN